MPCIYTNDICAIQDKKFNKIDVRIKVNNKMSQPLDYDLKHNQTAE